MKNIEWQVVLACCREGTKLKPIVIFKQKNVLKINNKHRVVVSAQEKGWMNVEQMKVWIEKAWCAWLGGLGRRSLLLLWCVWGTCDWSCEHENTDLVACHSWWFNFNLERNAVDGWWVYCHWTAKKALRCLELSEMESGSLRDCC